MKEDVEKIIVDQCAYGQRSAEGEAVKEPTAWMSNSPDILAQLGKGALAQLVCAHQRVDLTKLAAGRQPRKLQPLTSQLHQPQRSVIQTFSRVIQLLTQQMSCLHPRLPTENHAGRSRPASIGLISWVPSGPQGTDTQGDQRPTWFTSSQVVAFQ